MFGTNWSDPQTLWLNITNLALGLVTLAAVGVLSASIVRELWLRRRRSAEVNGLDAELQHMMHVPELGWTMADGGKPVKPGVAGEPNDQRRS
jgi:hypothetical protein